MKKLILPALAAIMALGACTTRDGSAAVIEVDGGRLQGVEIPSDPGVTLFKGIPYAAPPVGDLRWRRPQPVVPWDTVLVADTWGKVPVQNDPAVMGYMYVHEFYPDGLPPSGEDCLYLNVWAPTATLGDRDAALPVAMWIHGGAFDHGWSHEMEMDGRAWAERGVILVTINYREGILGCLSHPALAAEDPDGLSGNYTLLDQIAALSWVHDNIAAFGGDPARITVVGQSAGARSVQNLVSSPASRSMIAGAIIQSGGGIGEGPVADPGQAVADAEARGKALMDAHRLFTADDMRRASATELLSIFNSNGKIEGVERVSFRPHADGRLLPADFTGATLSGAIADVPYMIGYVTGDGPRAAVAADAFCRARDSLSTRPAYLYSFERALPGDDSGAFHSAELWYTFGTLDRAWRPFTDADRALSERMIDCWTRFIRTGDPNGTPDSVSADRWEPYSAANRAPKVFDVPR